MKEVYLKIIVIMVIIGTGTFLSFHGKLDKEIFGLLMLIAGQLTRSVVNDK